MRHFVSHLARWCAYAGGTVLVGLAGLTCLSILGRGLNTLGHLDLVTHGAPAFAGALQALGPITGDYEIMEAGIAFAVFACLPWCHLTHGHARIDILTNRLPERVREGLAGLWDGAFALAYALIAWRLSIGAFDKARYGETSLLLQLPVWWSYTACAIAAWLAVLVALAGLVSRARPRGGEAV